MGDGDWFCDDCLSHNPIEHSLYDKPKENDSSFLRKLERFSLS